MVLFDACRDLSMVIEHVDVMLYKNQKTGPSEFENQRLKKMGLILYKKTRKTRRKTFRRSMTGRKKAKELPVNNQLSIL